MKINRDHVKPLKAQKTGVIHLGVLPFFDSLSLISCRIVLLIWTTLP
ncbi:hypothetical protein CAGA_22870 [Caproiciproducens galactitolivorans]|uniref:Uncharacterized protein n=1 Tax=Caproiciproducens galactitolivorans TaxID=642589 RepID=A0A4Z0Y9E2_9FIRM|nr:hypothetical protein CAGA_22870 [Caproiciproducens galactitolivorans]